MKSFTTLIVMLLGAAMMNTVSGTEECRYSECQDNPGCDGLPGWRLQHDTACNRCSGMKPCHWLWQRRWKCCKPTPRPTPKPTRRPTNRPTLDVSNSYVGRWELLGSVKAKEGVDKGFEMALEIGVCFEDGTEYSQTEEKTISKSIEVGVEFNIGVVAGSTSVKLTNAARSSVTTATSSSIEKCSKETQRWTCVDRGVTSESLYAFRWVIESDDHNLSVKTAHFICKSTSELPNCPFTRCGNGECTKCEVGTFQDPTLQKRFELQQVVEPVDPNVGESEDPPDDQPVPQPVPQPVIQPTAQQMQPVKDEIDAGLIVGLVSIAVVALLGFVFVKTNRKRADVSQEDSVAVIPKSNV